MADKTEELLARVRRVCEEATDDLFFGSRQVTWQEVLLVVGKAELAEQLLEACMAAMDYWYACARSAADSQEQANHPGCHLSVDTPELQALCDKATELTAAAVQAAGVCVICGLPIRNTFEGQPLSDEKLRQLRPMMEDGLNQAVEDGALEMPDEHEEPSDG